VSAEIVSTVEHYFSDENLLTDVHLHNLMARDKTGGQWVRLEDILRFPKLKRLTTKAFKARAAAALASSTETANSQAAAGTEGTGEAVSTPVSTSPAPIPALASLLVEILGASTQLEVSSSADSPSRVRRAAHRPPPRPIPKAGDPLSHLVLDSGALIHGSAEELRTKAEHFWTVPEVIAEIRDERTRKVLSALPFELRTKDPSDESMAFICRFAKASGDYSTLSLVDLKVLALAYMLEKQESGDKHLRATPALKSVAAQPGNSAATPQPRKVAASAPTSGGKSDGAVSQDTTLAAQDEVEVANAKMEALSMEAGASSQETGPDEAKKTSEADGPDTGNQVEDTNANAEYAEDLGSDDEWDPNQAEAAGQFDDEDLEEDDDDESANDDENDDAQALDDQLHYPKSNNPSALSMSTEEDPKPSTRVYWGNAPEAKPEPFVLEAEAFPSISGDQTAVKLPAPAWGAKAKPAAEYVKASAAHVPSSEATAVAPQAWARQRPLPETNALVGGAGSSLKAKDDAAGQQPSATSALAEEATPTSSSSSPPVGMAGKSRLLGAASSGMAMASGTAEEDDGVGWFGPSTLKAKVAMGEDMSGQRRIDTAGEKKKSAGAPASSSTGAVLGSKQTSSSEGKKLEIKETSSSSAGVPTKSDGGKGQGGKKSGKGGQGSKGGKGGKGQRKIAQETVARSGCVTTDFAMQSVLLGIGLRLLSVDGYLVKRVSQYVLRCNACFLVQPNTEKLFCGRCGGSHLSRVAASVDPNTGAQVLHLKSDYKYKQQGTQYALPKPGAQRKGRFQGAMVLREDQLMMGIWAQKTAPKAKEKTSMFGAEVNEKTGVNVKKSAHTVVVGAGRQNPNAAKGRERRGQKKK